MMYLYVITLFVPLLLSFLDFDSGDSDDFFTLFSVNKALFFLNGIILGNLCGFNLFYGVVIGVVQGLMYYTGFKLLKKLEYKPSFSLPKTGDICDVYMTITPEFEGKVNFKGDTYYATSNVKIESFKKVKVTGVLENTNTLIVEEINKETI